MKPLLEWIRTGLKKRKVKVFLLFLICASLAWFINKLSQTYTSNTTFYVNYINVPSKYLLANSPKEEIQVRLTAAGFQFLGYHLKPKHITLDVSKMVEKDSLYYLTSDQIRIQLEDQLNNYSTLTDFDSDLIYFDFTSLETKKVPVIAMLDITYATNHILEGKIGILPDSIELTGPKSKIDTINTLKTELLQLNNIISTFSEQVALKLPQDLEGINFSATNVQIKGKVVKFSEQVMEIPVTVINVPEGVKVRTFPEIVQVRCQGTIQDLKELETNDFMVVADYLKVADETENRLAITLERYPKTLHNAQMNANEVEFILRRE
ncbi:CdaR family protein [Maribacter sp. MAR_2009_72]|uniref:CdaR family protein n=1 Tax=Maribacter sp. MAR_2009_72 TaxID=1250050 RepID=UPI00119BE2FE|nr:CdaR family protein [Maribacter sp. MAR_2009_72]TVZ14450.1 YbbR-like protein [Maribacter sp. MAR_2009_72]